MIKAVIFDMDGLLIDSEPFWRTSHQAVLARYGYHVTEDDVRAAAGKRTTDQVEVWQERFGFTEPDTATMTNQVVDSVIASINENGKPMPGVVSLIRELSQRDVPMAVASSSSEKLIEVVLDRLEIRQYLQVIHSGEHEKRGKPFPDVFLTTAQSLQVAPADCLVFEDSLNGVRAAKAAGMKCIAVPEESYDHQIFAAEKPERIIDSLKNITWSDIKAL